MNGIKKFEKSCLLHWRKCNISGAGRRGSYTNIYELVAKELRDRGEIL